MDRFKEWQQEVRDRRSRELAALNAERVARGEPEVRLALAE